LNDERPPLFHISSGRLAQFVNQTAQARRGRRFDPAAVRVGFLKLPQRHGDARCGSREGPAVRHRD
jgi:hypothetical protein